MYIYHEFQQHLTFQKQPLLFRRKLKYTRKQIKGHLLNLQYPLISLKTDIRPTKLCPNVRVRLHVQLNNSMSVSMEYSEGFR